MSRTTTALLTCASFEQGHAQPLLRLNTWLTLEGFSTLKQVHDYPLMLLGEWKHFPEADFIDLVASLEWEAPEGVSLAFCVDEGWGEGIPHAANPTTPQGRRSLKDALGYDLIQN